MGSGGRSERERVGSDGGRTRYQGDAYRGVREEEMAFPAGRAKLSGTAK